MLADRLAAAAHVARNWPAKSSRERTGGIARDDGVVVEREEPPAPGDPDERRISLTSYSLLLVLVANC